MIPLVLAGCASGDPPLEYLAEREDEPLPMIVMVHGYGDRPESMLKLVRDCGLPARTVAPRGPMPHPSGNGFAWYRVSFTDHGVERDTAAIGEVTERVAALLRWLRDERHPSKLVLSGFSQGGILSFTVATRHPELVDAAVPVSGVLPEGLAPGPAPAHAPPIRALHGDRDTLLPVADTRAAVDRLRELGWDATLEEFPGVAHQITAEVDQALCRDLEAALR
jgi:phospholipase/carboxylesterase